MIPSVLQKISDSVSIRLNERKSKISRTELEALAEKSRAPFAFEKAFNEKDTAILAEIKFKSPAHGALQTGSAERAVKIATLYTEVGASAISVLTEQDHFQGRLKYLAAVREALPNARLLMKDFVLDEYQILEARVQGADAVLLIVALLGEDKTRMLAAFARKQGLSTLVEVHDEAEFEIARNLACDLIGVNNRNLKTLAVSLKTSERLAHLIPNDKVVLSESGIQSRSEIIGLQALGYRGFLMGGALMQANDTRAALKELLGDTR